jgi:hypothetical protein
MRRYPALSFIRKGLIYGNDSAAIKSYEKNAGKMLYTTEFTESMGEDLVKFNSKRHSDCMSFSEFLCDLSKLCGEKLYAIM